MHVDVRKILSLFGGENDVGVVGQHEHVLRLCAVDRAQDVVDAGVHRLTAFYRDVCHEVVEDGFHAVARAYGDHGVRLEIFLLLVFLRFAFADYLAVLFHHVLDLDAVQLAEFQRRLERAVGIVGVDVRLD